MSALGVSVLGGGAWGGVLAWLAARRGHDVRLWEVDPNAAGALARDRTGPWSVPRFRLPAEVTVTTDLQEAVRGRDLVVVAVPSAVVRATLAAARPAAPPTPVVVCAHRENLPLLVGAAVAALRAGPDLPGGWDAPLPTAAFLAMHVAGGTLVAADRYDLSDT